jgi:hypothetical protein
LRAAEVAAAAEPLPKRNEGMTNLVPNRRTLSAFRWFANKGTQAGMSTCRIPLLPLRRVIFGATSMGCTPTDFAPEKKTVAAEVLPAALCLTSGAPSRLPLRPPLSLNFLQNKPIVRTDNRKFRTTTDA